MTTLERQKQKTLTALRNEVKLCKKRVENGEYSRETTEHFIRGLERAIYLIETKK